MKLTRSALYRSVKRSSAIEGIRHPFANGDCTFWPKTMDELVMYWKKRVAESAGSSRQKAARAAPSHGPSPRG